MGYHVHPVQIGRGFSLQLIGFLESVGGPSSLTVPDFRPRILQDFLRFRLEPLYKDPVFLHQKYIAEGLSIAQIADEIYSSKDAVRKGLIRASIPLREAHVPHGRPSQHRYGQKMSSGQATAHKAEERVIAAIREMKANGLGLRAIARCLTQMKIPTKCRGKAWHPEMVKRIIESSGA